MVNNRVNTLKRVDGRPVVEAFIWMPRSPASYRCLFLAADDQGNRPAHRAKHL